MQIIAAQCRERLMAYVARFNFFPSFASFFPERVCFANPVYSTFHVDSTTYKLASRNGVYIAFFKLIKRSCIAVIECRNIGKVELQLIIVFSLAS